MKVIHSPQKSEKEIQEIKLALHILGDHWSGLILFCLLDNPHRFSDIEAFATGISPRTLTKRLQALEEFGLITKRQYKEFPPRTEYQVTPKAIELKESLMSLKKWAKKYCHVDQSDSSLQAH
ncbi:MAG: hxlR 2 [Candidatus Saccharibacteria bacterium]|nr:hxlR 2 [Candidatus Saccharibacteria bacterium]